jgi:glycerophosphoryl diester phosphodiesterase
MKEKVYKIFKNKIILSLLLVLGVIIVFMSVINIIPPKKVMEDNPFIVGKDGRPLIAAHRGGKNLQPENTFSAIDYSYEKYHVDIIEMDLYLTKDNYLILSHNSTINAYTELNGLDDYYIRDHTLEEIRMFNFGYNFKDQNGNYPYRNVLDGVDNSQKSEVLLENKLRVVTITELFEKYARTDVLYIIEIKDSGDRGIIACDLLVAEMEKYDLVNKVAVGTFKDEVESYLNKTYPNVIRGGSFSVAKGFIITQMLGVNLFDKSSFSCLQIPSSYNFKDVITLNLAKKTYINRAHRRGMSVQYWTINDKEEMIELINLGVDVIMTDNPDVLYEVLVEMGYYN